MPDKRAPATLQEDWANGQSFAVPPPQMSLPKGGVSIRSLGEKEFAANPVNGTDSVSVPIATSPGRAGFGPQLGLSYESGTGKGPFGIGWSLSLPSITRRTDKGLPQYRDAEESDVYILSGAEGLVSVYKRDPDGNWARDHQGQLIYDEESRNGYSVKRHRTRIERLFARIERGTRLMDSDTHLRSISKDNILMVYGGTPESRIADQVHYVTRSGAGKRELKFLSSGIITIADDAPLGNRKNLWRAIGY